MPRGIPNTKKAAEPAVIVPAVVEPPVAIGDLAREKDMVLVRALERGYCGHCIRNVGEVFEMPTMGMRRWPLEGKEKERVGHDPILVKTQLGTFELPTWVTTEKRERVKEEELVPHGHKTAHGIQNGDVL